jgi:mycothiol synthase
LSRSTGCACSVTDPPQDDFGATTLSLATTARPCNYADDRSRLVDLWLACRIATSVELYPTIWRLCLLLTSRVWNPALDTQIWEDATGDVVGFAMLWRRRREDAYLVLERFVHPTSATGELAHTLLGWGTERARAIAAEQAMPLTLFASALHPNLCPDDRPESYGYVQTAPDPPQHNVYFARPVQGELPLATLPAGYTIRRLAHADEQEAYQDLYDFAAVNPYHRQELLASDEYGHLVIVDAPVGRAGMYQAYCEVSICRAEWRLGGGRIGWIDYVGTRPEKQRQGLGRAVLLAGLRELRAWGAESARLVTVSTSTPAIRLYLATGFQRVEAAELPVYEMQIPGTRISPVVHPAGDESLTLGATDFRPE